MSDTAGRVSYYSAIVEGLTDVFKTPVIRTRRGIVSFVIDDVTYAGAFKPTQELDFYAMTRRQGGPWLGVPFRIGQVISAVNPGQGSGDWYLRDDFIVAPVLDETVVIVQTLDNNGSASAAGALTDVAGNGATFGPVGGLAGGHGNLFSVQALAQPLPGQPFALQVIDDPDIAGNFLATWSPSTDSNGVALSPWNDVDALFAQLSAPLITAPGIIGNGAATMKPVAKSPMTGGLAGAAPTPVTFRLTIE